MWGEMVGPAQRASLVKSAEQGKEDQAPNICFAVSPRIEGSDQWMGTWAFGYLDRPTMVCGHRSVTVD